MKMCVGGKWVDKPDKLEVRHPFDNHVVDSVPRASAADVDAALAAAARGAKVMAKLTAVLLEAGLPPEAISCLAGPGGELGELLCRDPRVRKISFTGSVPVGRRICEVAGLKKVTMELGSNSPIIVMPDADLNKVAEAVAATGYSNAGQVCISTQRVVAHRRIYDDALAAAKIKVEALPVGNPLDEK